MSFFADMLAGGAAGLGQGMVNYAQMDEREKQMELAAQEKAELAKQLAQQRSEDKAAQIAYQKEALAARYGDGVSGGAGGSSSGGGRSSGMNLMQMAIEARKSKDPEQIQTVIDLTRTYQGQDAAATLADQFFGKPMQDKTQVTDETDAARIANDPMLSRQGAVAATRDKGGNLAYDGNKGAQALQRMYALAQDPAKMDDVVKAQRGGMLMDNASDAGATIKDPVKRATLEQSLSNPTSTQAAVDAKEYAADKGALKRTSGGGSKSTAQEKLTTEKNAALRERSGYVSQLKDAGKATRPAIQEKIDKVDADLERINRLLADARPDSGAAPAAPKKWEGFSAVPVGK